MNNISYKFNLTLFDQKTIVKALEVVENENDYCEITVLSSDYSMYEIYTIFYPSSTVNCKSIIKTSKEAVFIRKYENYVVVPDLQRLYKQRQQKR